MLVAADWRGEQWAVPALTEPGLKPKVIVPPFALAKEASFVPGLELRLGLLGRPDIGDAAAESSAA